MAHAHHHGFVLLVAVLRVLVGRDVDVSCSGAVREEVREEGRWRGEGVESRDYITAPMINHLAICLNLLWILNLPPLMLHSSQLTSTVNNTLKTTHF